MGCGQHQAAVLPGPKEPLEIQTVLIPIPGPDEILYKNLVLALNPVDAKLAKLAFFPVPYPFILGLIGAGIVEAVGSEVKDIKIGDRVVGQRINPEFADNKYGAFQQYVVAKACRAVVLPDGVKLEDAAATAGNLVTIIVAHEVFLGLERPPADGKKAPKKGKKLLVYGGSSGVGGLFVKHAADAGYDVVTTSSPANKGFVQSLGAAAIIDHTQNQERIVEGIKQYGPYEAGWFDSIGKPATTLIMAAYLSSTGGGKYFTVQPPLGPDDPAHNLPSNVERVFVSYPGELAKPEHEELQRWMIRDYIPNGLENGAIVPTRFEKISGGLKAIQTKAMPLLLDGVSGKKLVLDPWEE